MIKCAAWILTKWWYHSSIRKCYERGNIRHTGCPTTCELVLLTDTCVHWYKSQQSNSTQSTDHQQTRRQFSYTLSTYICYAYILQNATCAILKISLISCSMPWATLNEVLHIKRIEGIKSTMVSVYILKWGCYSWMRMAWLPYNSGYYCLVWPPMARIWRNPWMT